MTKGLGIRHLSGALGPARGWHRGTVQGCPLSEWIRGGVGVAERRVGSSGGTFRCMSGYSRVRACVGGRGGAQPGNPGA